MASPSPVPLWAELEAPTWCRRGTREAFWAAVTAAGLSFGKTWGGSRAELAALGVLLELLQSVPLIAWFALTYIILEVLFYYFLKHRARHWRAPLDHSSGQFPPVCSPTREELLRKIEAYMCASRKHAEELLAGWYFGEDIDSLSRADAEAFLAWAVYTRRWHELAPGEAETLSGVLDRVEAAVGLAWGKARPGGRRHWASEQRMAAHTWEEDCRYRHWPLCMYLPIYALQHLVDPVVLRLLGFQRGRRGLVGYWIRRGAPHRPGAAGDRPWDAFVFLHGILATRLLYLIFLHQFRDETVVFVDMPWVAFNPLCSRAPKPDAFCESVADMLDAHGLRTVSIAGHSYGSFVAAWLRYSPRLQGRVARLVLVSAPALYLFHPKTCRCVIYDKPMWFEHGLAHVFFRQLFWYQSVLTAEDLPKGSVVVLCKEDEMIPVEEVLHDCREHGVRCFVQMGIPHGFELFCPWSCCTIARFIQATAVEGGSCSKGDALACRTLG